MARKRHKLHLVREAEADGRTREIFEEIKQALGIPYVNMMFQAFASFPEFFELFWQTLKPVLATREFFAFSERIGADGYTRMHNYFAVPDLRSRVAAMQFSPGAQSEIIRVVDLYHYNYPTLLLICAALAQAFEDPREPSLDKVTVTAAHPLFGEKPIMVEETVAPVPTRRVYEEIKRTLGTPFLNTCYLNFGRWPDFLQAYWESLKPVLKMPLYEHHRHAIESSALRCASELPEPLLLSLAHMEEAGVPADDVNAITSLTETFLNLLSKQVLNIAFAKIALEGGVRSQAAA